jgi:FAD/FMN-containing dehydrogenase
MVSKVSDPRGADSSGIYRRPRLVLRVKRSEDLPGLLAKTRTYPTPIRMVGGDYSQTRCVGGDGGTTVDSGGLDKILEIGENTVRAQAGVRVSTLVMALAERGLELPLTPEMGRMSLGAVAVTTLPQASYSPGCAQLSSCVTEMKRDRDLIRVLRSSFGLLGMVHEVELRVRPLTPVRIDYQIFSLKEFTARYAALIEAPGALRLHISAFHDRITVERRTLDESAAASRSGIWQIRKSVMRNVLPAFGSTVGSVLAAPGLRAAVVSGMHRAFAGRTRGVVTYAHEWMRELPKEAWKAGLTFSLWAFPQADYPRLLAGYFAFCKAYHKQHRYRCNLVSGASRLHQDKGSLFSLSYAGPQFTLEPSSSGENGWDDFLIDFNEFATSHGGTPTFNQTRALKPEHVQKAFGERARLFRALRQRTDPLNRLRNAYFAYLLG